VTSRESRSARGCRGADRPHRDRCGHGDPAAHDRAADTAAISCSSRSTIGRTPRYGWRR
jgi:hypothetical protein